MPVELRTDMAKISKYAQLIADNHELDADGLKSFHSEKLGYTVYWKADDYKTKLKYYDEIIDGSKTTGLLKCFIYRALDDKGKRMFRTQDDANIVLNATDLYPAIFEVAAEMIGGNTDELLAMTDDEQKKAEKN